MPLGDRGYLVHALVERCCARRPGPLLHCRVENEPHHVAILALELAHHEPAATSRGFPCDAFEWITAHMLAQLVELGPRARTPFGRAGLGCVPRAASARG